MRKVRRNGFKYLTEKTHSIPECNNTYPVQKSDNTCDCDLILLTTEDYAAKEKESQRLYRETIKNISSQKWCDEVIM